MLKKFLLTASLITTSAMAALAQIPVAAQAAKEFIPSDSTKLVKMGCVSKDVPGYHRPAIRQTAYITNKNDTLVYVEDGEGKVFEQAFMRKGQGVKGNITLTFKETGKTLALFAGNIDPQSGDDIAPGISGHLFYYHKQRDGDFQSYLSDAQWAAAHNPDKPPFRQLAQLGKRAVE